MRQPLPAETGCGRAATGQEDSSDGNTDCGAQNARFDL